MKTLKKKIKMIVEKTDTGFSAYSVDYPIYTTGKTITDLINSTGYNSTYPQAGFSCSLGKKCNNCCRWENIPSRLL